MFLLHLVISYHSVNFAIHLYLSGNSAIVLYPVAAFSYWQVCLCYQIGSKVEQESSILEVQ